MIYDMTVRFTYKHTAVDMLRRVRDIADFIRFK
jgi:hypothetical protein